MREGKGYNPLASEFDLDTSLFFDERLDDADHSRVTSDVRHMADAGTCASLVAFRDWRAT